MNVTASKREQVSIIKRFLAWLPEAERTTERMVELYADQC